MKKTFKVTVNIKPASKSGKRKGRKPRKSKKKYARK